MGVPKFFRWMSERYPAISQLIAENRIPEFDCLYLDMNGIIHNCTHKDGDRADFRMTEDAMFIAIFNYIEHLFGKIKPKKLFFMAIDGVAPRAKMNQQRSRRFRTALDAEKARDKAIKEGIEMPSEPPFDSNCITPGTEFMARLSRQLKYFIHKKVTEDSDWQGVEVVLSGHEVPGEGEHKIMEYIRQAKSQPGYDANRRHCLYGLDADLIMLGLLSHDPHFCLLREEVTFGPQRKKQNKELEHQNFYLMHLCIVREYLELEFQELKEPGALSFTYDMERIIDDFILMAFFVGNDFLPNLPHLHINEGALSLMFDVYKKTLPKMQGYMNQGGQINLERLGLLLDELSKVEYRFFEAENSDASWLKSKQRMDDEEHRQVSKKGKLTITSQQREIFRGIKKWVNQNSESSAKPPYDLPVTLAAKDREFVKQLADNLHVQWNTVENDSGDRFLQLNWPSSGDDEEQDEEEAQSAVFRIIKRYDNAQIVDVSADQAHEEMEKKYQEKFWGWKNQYYATKFEWGLKDEEELRKLAENYVQGLQWVLFYYYRGVASWPWYFQYHYSPMISDVKRGLKADMNFTLGQPFKPYQQLMGVLPDRSKSIVPTVYHDLMTNPDSPIIDFYPRDFELDMNGKKMEWEAVVKIPFINEKRLLEAMATKDDQLTDAEKGRNDFGVSLKFAYSSDVSFTYPSSIPGVFNDIPNCKCVENIFELPTMEGLDVFVGLVDGVKLGEAALAGFPSLKTLPFGGQLAFHGVSVFQQESRNQSMVATLLDAENKAKSSAATEKLGQVCHIGYPFLQEARIFKVSDEMFDYTLSPSGGPPEAKPHNDFEIRDFQKKAERIETVYSKRLGMIIGQVESLVHVELLRGLYKTDEGAMVKDYGEIPGMEIEYASQTVVDTVVSPDERFIERTALPIAEEFPVGSHAFFLGDMGYGKAVQVQGHPGGDKLEIVLGLVKQTRPDLQHETWARKLVQNSERMTRYVPSYAVAKQLNLNALALSKITSSLMVQSRGLKVNLGLNLKFESKKLKVLGYSRKSNSGWEFSPKAVQLIVDYMIKFPDFIAGLQRNPQGDMYRDTDFYSEQDAPAKMKEIGDWLKAIQSKSFEKVTLDAEQLDSDVVMQIEQTIDQINTNPPPLDPRRIKSVPRHALLKPEDAEQRLGSQSFAAGDRILYVQDSGKVPLGLTGTVVGLTRTSRTTLLDVVFDNTFMSGTSLSDRCSPFRGQTVASSSSLNLTNRQVLVGTTASSNRNAQQPRPYYANGQSSAINGQAYGALGQQLRPAAAPAPLQGSFRGAINGQSNGRGGRGGAQAIPLRPHNGAADSSQQPARGGRGGGGRGGAGRGRGGFTVIDNTDPTEGVLKHNPYFRKTDYSAVAPPASLENGRGRGGRGGRGRGRGGRGGRGRGDAAAAAQ